MHQLVSHFLLISLLMNTALASGTQSGPDTFRDLDEYDVELNVPTTNPQRPTEISVLNISILPELATKSCSLVGDKYQALLAELKVISEEYNTKCISQAQNIITDINKDVESIEGLHAQAKDTNNQVNENSDDNEEQDSDKEEENNNPLSQISTAQARKIQENLDGLGAIISKKQCKQELKEHGIMPIIQGTLQSVSNIALLVPNSQSITIGLTASLMNTTIEVFKEVMKPEFQWSNEEELDAFLRFNCSYINITKKINAEGVYDIKDTKLEGKISNLRKTIDDIKKEMNTRFPHHKEVETLNKSKKTLISLADQKRKNLVRQVVLNTTEKSRYDIALNDFEEILKGLSQIKFDSKASFNISKANIFTKLTPRINSLNEKIKDFTPKKNTPFLLMLFNTVKDATQKLSNENASQIMSYGEEEIKGLISELTDAKLYFLNIYERSYEMALEILTPTQLKTMVASIETNKEIEQKIDVKVQNYLKANLDSYSKERALLIPLEKKLKTATENLKRLEMMYTPYGEEQFSINNAPSNNAKAIRDEDKKNANRIYGPVGFSLMQYLVEESEIAIENYKYNIKAMLNEMPDKDFEQIQNDKEKLLYCNNLYQMRRVYADSNFPTELAYDFAVTNLPLFHNLYEKNIILTDERKELRYQVFSALYAKSLIDKYKDETDTQISSIKELVNAADNLEYPEKVKVCTNRPKYAWEKSKDRKPKTRCSEEYQKTLINSSVGREMIKLIEIEEQALQFQRSYYANCRSLNHLPVPELP